MVVTDERPIFPHVTLTKAGIMKKTMIAIAAVTFTLTLSSCGNTIRGVGQDTANTVDATQSAGKRVDRAAKY
jgi:entericidin B